MANFAWISRLTSQQKRIWAIGGGIIFVGFTFKMAYFNFSRGLILDGMEKKHLKAMNHLQSAREFAHWSENDRNQRLPPLNEEQKRQLQEYLDLVSEKQFGEPRR